MKNHSLTPGLAIVLTLVLVAAPAWAEPLIHALAMHGSPKYGPEFTHFDYVNPDAPKGGNVRLAAIGSFDTLNPFIIKGDAAAGIGGLYDSLTTASADEPFSRYGLLAESMEIAEDRSWIVFTLRPEARWHDGKPVTVELATYPSKSSTNFSTSEEIELNSSTTNSTSAV